MSQLQIEHTKNSECINMWSDKDISVIANNNEDITIVKNRTINVMEGNHIEKISKGFLDHDVEKGTAKYHVMGDLTEIYEGTQSTSVTKEIKIISKANIYIQAETNIQLHVGDSHLTMDKDGNILLKGKSIQIIGSEKIVLSAPKIDTTGSDQVTVGVGNQQATFNKMKVNVSGAAINSSAVGMHEITGGLIKIN